MQLPLTVSAVPFERKGPLLTTESRSKAALVADDGFGSGPAEQDLLIGRTLEATPISSGHRRAGYRLQSQLHLGIEAELAADVEATPSAPDLLERLASRIPLAGATNSRAPCPTPP